MYLNLDFLSVKNILITKFFHYNETFEQWKYFMDVKVSSLWHYKNFIFKSVVQIFIFMENLWINKTVIYNF